MGFKNIKGNVKNSFLDYFVSGKAVQYHTAEFGLREPLTGLTATGGVISDYTDGPAVYRAHVFTSTGTFSVSALSTDPALPSSVEYLVVAGGGGSTSYYGGGGAGGYRSSVTGESSGGGNSAESALPVSTSPGSYTVTIGAGGGAGTQGTPSVFGPGPIAATGGGYGASYNVTGGSGGSGGGTGDYPRGGRVGPADNYPGPSAQGYPGGQGASDQNTYTYGGGGGGAGGAAQSAPVGPNPSPHPGLSGGNGVRTAIAGPSYSIGTPGPASPGGYGGGPSTAVTGGWLAGGGSGTGASGNVGGAGGGGNGTPGTYSTGGGGGSNPGGSVANGGSGIVVVRYQIASLTATAKATGGAISFYSGKTIHTFTGSGTFTAPGSFSEPQVEYFIVGGGGGGGGTPSPGSSGGAGGGGYKTATIPLAGPFAAPVTVGAGGGRNTNGVDSVFAAPSPQTGGGGGYGGPRTSGGNPAPLGSGGGGGSGANGGTGGPQGNNGGNGDVGSGVAGGGGGAGQVGQNATGPSVGGYGGYGIQIPATFRNPVSAPGPNGGGIGDDGTYGASPDGPGPQPGSYWFAGGGGGGGQTNTPTYSGGRGGSGGGGKGGAYPSQAPIDGQNGLTNVGGGGGGGGNDSSGKGGLGGSGIVIIAYPS